MHLRTITPEAALRTARFVWVCAMAWQGMVIAIYLWTIKNPWRILPFPEVFFQLLGAAAMVALMCACRGHSYKANWVKDAITPWGYMEAHLVMATLPSVLLVIDFVYLLMAHGAGPGMGITTSLVFLVTFIAAFPDGKPMQDHPMRL
jgi:hypothetical protein